MSFVHEFHRRQFLVLQIKNLRLFTILGVKEKERETKQEIVIQLRIEFEPPERVWQSDRLSDTLDYSLVVQTMKKRVKRSSYVLLERLAYVILSDIKEDFAKDFSFQKIELEIEKPQAIEFADRVSIALLWERSK